MDLLQEMVDHARADAPNEACGLVVASGRRHRLVRARNVSETPIDTFEIEAEAWMHVEDGEEVVGIYHSHPRSPPQPSPADLTMCEVTGVPWHIVDLIGGYTCTNPSGYVAPYTKRPYVYGVHDCYSIARDWYNREWDLGIPDFDRQHEWWERGENLFVDNFESVGFVSIPREQPKVGDAFLFQVSSKVPNHVAVYIGNGLILHHVRFRLSCQELYGGLWAKTTTHQLRHTSRIPSHG